MNVGVSKTHFNNPKGGRWHIKPNWIYTIQSRKQNNNGSRRTKRRKTRGVQGGQAPTHFQGLEAKSDLRFITPIFPAVTRRRLFYYDYDLGRSGVAGAVSNYFFTANGLFDPNITGTGHQPMGFDQMMLMYEQYTVIASKISVHIYNSTASVAIRTGVYVAPDTTALTDPLQIMENGLITTKVLSAINVAGYHADFNINVDCMKYFGRSRNAKDMLNDTLLYGTAAANPTEQVFYSIVAWDPFGASNYSNFFDVVIEYDAIFWEPRKLTVS